ncbi:MAG TPA: outer membrane lipoprotein-sorting protein [Polyangiales bacterium]
MGHVGMDDQHQALSATHRLVRRLVRKSASACAAWHAVAQAGLCLLLVVTAFAQAGEPTADEIARRLVRSDAFSWEGARTHVRMLLNEENGQSRERVMDILGRRKNGLFQTLVRFLSPQDIAGTAFLMLERDKETSEQYIYLPGLKRTRRIVGREREGSFMGSDFTYTDMQRIDSRYATNKRLPDEALSGEAAYVLESTLHADAPSSYGRVMTWVRKSDYVALRTRFYDKQDKLVKTLYTRKVKQIDGKPVVVDARMQSQLSKHSTDLFIESVERRDDLSDASFTPAALEHL